MNPNRGPTGSGGTSAGTSSTSTKSGAQRFAIDAAPLIALLPAGARPRLVVAEGCVWVTQAGDHRDHLLRAGDQFWPAAAGAVVVQRLSPRAQVTCDQLMLRAA